MIGHEFNCSPSVGKGLIESLEIDQGSSEFEVSSPESRVCLDREAIRTCGFLVALSKPKRVAHVEVSKGLSGVQPKGFAVRITRRILIADTGQCDTQIHPREGLNRIDREASTDGSDRIIERSRPIVHLPEGVKHTGITRTEIERFLVRDCARCEVTRVPGLISQESEGEKPPAPKGLVGRRRLEELNESASHVGLVSPTPVEGCCGE